MIKLIGGSFSQKKKNYFEWGTPTLENPEIAGKPWKSRFSRKIIIHASPKFAKFMKKILRHPCKFVFKLKSTKKNNHN
jgi:hypothetical protein